MLNDGEFFNFKLKFYKKLDNAGSYLSFPEFQNFAKRRYIFQLRNPTTLDVHGKMI